MIVIMKPHCTRDQMDHVVHMLDEMGCQHWIIEGSEQNVVEVLGPRGRLDRDRLAAAPMVERVLDRADPIRAAGRVPGDETREIPLGTSGTVGGRQIAVIAGPCSGEGKSALDHVYNNILAEHKSKDEERRRILQRPQLRRPWPSWGRKGGRKRNGRGRSRKRRKRRRRRPDWR